MATIELVILSSSPPKVQRLDDPLSNAMSSSPTRFPSPNALVKQKQTLRTGGRAAPIPSNATASFMIAASLLKPKPTADALNDDSIWDFPDDDVMKRDVAKTKEPKVKAAPKPRVKKPAVPKDDIAEEKSSVKKPRKPRAKKGDLEEGGAPVVKDKAVRKPRTKKVDTEGQTKIPKGRVTKASTGSARAKGTKKTAVVSAHFATTSSEFIDIDDISQGKDLNLQKAAERRMDWTPPKATADDLFATDAIIEGDTDLNTTAKGFTDLLGTFGHSENGEPAVAPRPAAPIPARKRKLIELVKTNATMPSAQLTPKAKSVKKKPKTITERATSAYALEDEENVEPTPLLRYFSRQDSGMEVSSSSKSRSRSPAKKPSKGKKAAPPPPTLLAPEMALEQAKSQEFIFGTSSQLAREDDPDFLRDLQQAMQLSNQLDPFLDDLLPAKSGSATSKSGRFKPSLWEAASMIEEEGARDVEVLDFTNSSQVERYFAKETVPALSAGEKPAGSLPTPEADGDWYRLDSCPRSTQPDQPVATGAQVADIAQAEICPNTAQSKPSSIQVSMETTMSSGKPMASISQTDKATEVVTAVQRPDFESYSTSELAKEIASYKFKPIKKREQMIALLEKCWEGKQRTALGAVESNTLASKTIDEPPPSQAPLKPLPAALTSPKRPRGRPRKDSGTVVPSPKRKSKSKTVTENATSDSDTPLAARLTPKRRTKKSEAAVDEISDSDTPPTPSPPRRRASQIRTPPPLPLVIDTIDDAILRPLSPTSQERELFIHITAAVTTAPRTADPRRPSWYEKMLMYDPILLEDLTRWLNTEGLGRVRYDGEAQAVQVKRWCQSKSVCCIFKENSRNGGVKKIGREA